MFYRMNLFTIQEFFFGRQFQKFEVKSNKNLIIDISINHSYIYTKMTNQVNIFLNKDDTNFGDRQI